jgi:hypothetical protein
MTKKLEGKIAVVTGGTDFTPLNSETFFLAPHFSCVLQNGHATANPAVPRRQGESKEHSFWLVIPQQINKFGWFRSTPSFSPTARRSPWIEYKRRAPFGAKP